MIMTVDELRQYIPTDETDQVLEARIRALEFLIRAHTNNNFQNRAFRDVAVAISGDNTLIVHDTNQFRVGDTLQITETELNAGIVSVITKNGGVLTVRENLFDEAGILITKVVYPVDIQMGVVNLMKWELERRDKAGIASESISRHSVTYLDQTGANTLMGYPAALMGFLKPYIKARFGRGVKP